MKFTSLAQELAAQRPADNSTFARIYRGILRTTLKFSDGNQLAQLYFSNHNGAIIGFGLTPAVSNSKIASSLYIHVPFCRVRCSYCAFNTYTDLDHLIPAYVDALCRELECVAGSAPTRALATIYFGGGTPTLLNAGQFEQLFQALHSLFTVGPDAEISLEANPDDLSQAYLDDLRRVGFNRLSIGMQSADPRILRLFDRQHGLAAVADAMRFARAARFENVNLDVIFGSPYETLADWKTTVNSVIDLDPEHISMYGLELKGGTALRQRVDDGELPTPDDDDFADMYEFATAQLSRPGYRQYEISNWCRAGQECRHNLQYWRNHPYIGIGAGAHGFAGGYRYSTIAAPKRYIDALSQAPRDSRPFPLTPAAAKSTQVAIWDEVYETIMMSLRLTREGISPLHFRERFGLDFLDVFGAAVDKLAALELIVVSEERVRLSERGRLLSSAVIREFVAALPISE